MFVVWRFDILELTVYENYNNDNKWNEWRNRHLWWTIDVKCTLSDTEHSINDYTISLDSRHEMTRLDLCLSFKLV